MNKFVVLLISLCFLSHQAQAQPGWEAGGWLGATYYFGDLNTDFGLGLPGATAGLAGRFLFNDRVAVKGSLGVAYLRGDDAQSGNIYEYARNLSFRTDLAEAAVQIEFNFLPYEHGNYERFFTPYLLAGVSGMYFVPKAHYEGKWEKLRMLGTEGQDSGEEYSPLAINLLFGGGVKVDLNYRWSINVELGPRISFSDYLDDVSTVYPNKQVLANQRGDLAVALSDRSGEVDPANLPPNLDFTEIGQEGKQRGENSNKDNFIFLNVGLMYYFGQIRCPEPGSK